MSGAEADGSDESVDETTDDPTEFERQWAEARIEAGHSGDPFDYPTQGYEFAPILLLYVGLFLGPVAPVIFTLLLLKRRTPLRGILVIASVAVAAWLLLQGATWVFQEDWSTFQLQFVRSVCNFGVGIAAYLIVRTETKDSHAMTKGTLFNTAVALTLVVAAGFTIPSAWLMVLGR